MRLTALALVLSLVAACDGSNAGPPLTEELGFRQLRQDFHAARTVGDDELLQGLWADDAVLTLSDGTEIVGADAIADHIANDPGFGERLMLTTESRWGVAVEGNTAEYGFESIGVDLGGKGPTETPLAIGGAQNPDVEIVEHTNSTGRAARLADGRWVFLELTIASGPLTSTLSQEPPAGELTEDELGFQRMREDFHLSTLLGDKALLSSVWAENAVFVTGGGAMFEGRTAIVDFMSSGAAFGGTLVVTPEASARFSVVGENTAEYGFDCISIDVGANNDPATTDLCTAAGTQNPDVQIVRHTNSSGTLTKLPDGRWVFQQFNGGLGPLAPAAE
ncbi:MAG: hypothetical protein ACYTGN_04740 [Planctomycetota bacterium]|jgi:hypothetical protein